MPTYAYHCKGCDADFDVQQSFSDDALTDCPTCAGPVRKQFGAVGVVFKGSGFYRTDSRGSSSSSAGSSGSSSSGSSSSGSGSSKKSESSSSSSNSGSSASSSSSLSSSSSS